MISKTKTLKTIKEKVDSRTSGKIKLKKHIMCKIKDGVIRNTSEIKVCSLVKNGNSTMFVDDNYKIRNINDLDTKTLHKILWQLISDKEKKEIAYEHFMTKMAYLIS